jgi:hypothetical protein
MNIKVPTKCARCGRVSEAELPLEEVNSIVDNELARKNALEDLKKMILDTADVPNLPDAVILHKNEDGELVIEALDNLCSLDGKRNKGCKSRVNYLIEDIMFRIKHEKSEEKPTGETPKKKRRTKAEMEAAKADSEKA